MKPPIVINDSPELDKAGDLSVYDSEESALRALDAESALDSYLHVFDRSGDIYAIVFNENTQAVSFLKKTEERFSEERIKRLFQQHVERLKVLNVAPEVAARMSIDELLSLVYEFDPNPYSGMP